MRPALLLFCLSLSFAVASDPARFEPGLILRLSAGGETDTQVASMVSLDAPMGKAVSPILSPGPFVARWEGEIWSEQETEYSFGAAMRGVFTLTLNGEQVLEGAGDNTVQTMDKSYRLRKGANQFVAELRSDGTQDASIRLTWRTQNGPAELLPPAAFRHDANALDLRRSAKKQKP